MSTVVSMESHPARLLQAALRYAADGIPVFQVQWLVGGVCSCSKGPLCGQPGKHPASRKGFKDATTDEALIRRLWKAHPNANVGLAIGEANLVVVDIDPRNGGDLTLCQVEREYGDLPPTLTVNTGGGGLHYYYRLPDGTNAHCGVAGQGIDLKTSGGYVIAPPSTHYSGGRYEVESMSPDSFADAPQWIVDYVTRAPERKRAAGAAVDPIQSVFGAMFSAASMSLHSLGADRVAVECPWDNEHSMGAPGDSSTVVFAPTEIGGAGWFHCSHSHCAHRTQRDVWEAMPEAARSAALKLFRLSSLWSPSEQGSGLLPLPVDSPSLLKAAVDKEAAKPADSPPAATRPRWIDLLRFDGSRKLCKDPGNVALILTNHDEWAGVLSMDHLKGELMWTKAPPNADHFGVSAGKAWKDGDHVAVHHWFAMEQGVAFSRDNLEHGARIAGEQNAVDPVADYLVSLEWDGVERVSTWLETYMNAEDEAWARLAGRKWLISAVARALHPGCQVDHTLILEGGQGTGKSSALRVLARRPEWFLDDMPQIGDKDGKLATLGHWIIEFGELGAWQGVSLQKLKSWLTETHDTLRVPYARTMITRPRRCVFSGSTNEVGYLHDPTGARRFWPVRCSPRPCDVRGLERVVDQLWAEAVSLYAGGKGERWHLDSAKDVELAVGQQAQRTTRDPWAEHLLEKLRTRGQLWCTAHSGLELMGVPSERWTSHSGQRIGNILHGEGWTIRLIEGSRIWCSPADPAVAETQYKTHKKAGR